MLSHIERQQRRKRLKRLKRQQRKDDEYEEEKEEEQFFLLRRRRNNVFHMFILSLYLAFFQFEETNVLMGEAHLANQEI